MSSSNLPTPSLPSSTQFRQHPDSIAERLHMERMERLHATLREVSAEPDGDDEFDWFDLPPDATPEEEAEAFRNEFDSEPSGSQTFALRERSLISACPLDVPWRL
jgi:hypothetical protein